MSKRTAITEWYIAQDDADWAAHICAPLIQGHAPRTAPAAPGRLFSQRLRWEVVAIFLLLASAGSWWWHTAQVRSQQAEAEATKTAQQELRVAPSPKPVATSVSDDQTAPPWRLQLAREDRELRTAVKAGKPGAQFDLNVRVLAMQDDWAVVIVSTAAIARAPAYRQTRFYQRTAEGWQQTPPDAALWGPERSLGTPSFIFRFRQNDAPVVIAVAPQLEVLYTTLRQNFGLPITLGAEKLVIHVSVTQPPGHAASWFHVPARISVPSPALYRAPVELSDAELLAQSLALPLLATVLAQARERYQIRLTWQPLVSGLYLWQMWNLDLPLSAWRQAVVQWLYRDLPATPSGQAVVRPAQYQELCAAHRLWLPSPAQIEIPLLCTAVDWQAGHFPPRGPHNPFLPLHQIALAPPQYDPSVEINHPGRAVALATLVEYVVDTYGRDRLPVLVAGLGQYESWATLISAVYGVSPAEFEAGWQAYLAAHYGLPLRSPFAH